MRDYFAFMKEFPAFFDNKDAPLKIIKDRKTIQSWKNIYCQKLTEKKLPLEWAEIGILLDDPYNVLIRDLVEFPNGEMHGYIRSITSATLKSGNGVAILPEYKGKILLLHQYRHPTRRWHYEIPRGYGEPNTPSAKNAYKEIEEETGGSIRELVSLGEFYCNTGYEAIAVSLYYAKLFSIDVANKNEGIESFVWLSIKELEEWISTEKITDSFTITTYIKAKLKGLI